MNDTIRILALALGATLLAPAAAAQVYKWTDANGKVHYSNQKPPDVAAQTVKIESAPATTPTTVLGLTPPAAAPTAAGDNPNADVNAQLAALDQQRCTAAKAVAARYESAPFLQKNGADGKPQKLSVEEEAAERLKVKADVERLCQGK